MEYLRSTKFQCPFCAKELGTGEISYEKIYVTFVEC